jgi:hypothetical protein
MNAQTKPKATLRYQGPTAINTSGKHHHDRVECADGFSVSVQASQFHYCTPREDGGPWTHVELGFPSARPEPWRKWRKYAEDADRPTDTVYAYVPVQMVIDLITSHGGEQ